MSTTDIFGNNSTNYPQVSGGIKFNSTSVMGFQKGSAKGAKYDGFIVQNYQINYQQNITKLRGLNTADVVSVVTPPTGNMVLGTALINATKYFAFLADYGDACKVKDNNLLLNSNDVEACGSASTSGNTTWEKLLGFFGVGAANKPLIMKGCLISQIQLSQSIENLILMSQLSLEFVSLDKS